MSMLFPPIGQMPEPGEKSHPRGLIETFDQGRWWRTRDAGWVRIKDMHPTHRANAAALLIRQAPALASRVSWIEFATLDRWLAFGMGKMAADAVESEMAALDERRTTDPEEWMANTKLYRSLTRPRKRDAERWPSSMANTGILPNAHRCADCTFTTASDERMDGYLRATGHRYECGPQFIGGVEYP